MKDKIMLAIDCCTRMARRTEDACCRSCPYNKYGTQCYTKMLKEIKTILTAVNKD